MKIEADDKNLLYSGRIDWTDSKEPVWIYPSTSVKIRFTGKVLKIYVSNFNAYWSNSLGLILDNRQHKLDLPENGETVLEINAGGNEHEEHNAMLFKRQDSCHLVKISGFETAPGEEFLFPGEHGKRRIEVFGDSVSAGEVTEAVEFTGKVDPIHNGQYSNSWYSYAWITARNLGAEIHNISQGGIALIDNTGWFYEPDAIGMETVWNKTCYNPQFGKAKDWDFSNYIPQVVIIALGQNDSHPEDYMKDNYNGEKSKYWRKKYKAFIEKIRGVYKDAHIICITTLLNHDANWDKSIGEVVDEINDKKVTQYLFKRNGKGTPGHLRISESEEMAEELTKYIESLNIEDWNR